MHEACGMFASASEEGVLPGKEIKLQIAVQTLCECEQTSSQPIDASGLSHTAQIPMLLIFEPWALGV